MTNKCPVCSELLLTPLGNSLVDSHYYFHALEDMAEARKQPMGTASGLFKMTAEEARQLRPQRPKPYPHATNPQSSGDDHE